MLADDFALCLYLVPNDWLTQTQLLNYQTTKLAYLQALGIDVVERVPLLVGVNQFNVEYLAIKGAKMGHFIPAHVKPI